MSHDILVERLFETLIDGDRVTARALISDAREQGYTPEKLAADVFWPTYELISRLYRADQLTTLSHHLATRLLRILSDQNAGELTFKPNCGRSVFVISGPTEFDEVAAEIAADLLECEGFGVTFAGGGIATDEILGHVQESQPDVLLMFASAPTDLPAIRELIDQINEIGACGDLQIAVGGGVFNRAEGLAMEIGADLWETTPMGIVEEIVDNPEHKASEDQRTVGRKRTNKPASGRGSRKAA